MTEARTSLDGIITTAERLAASDGDVELSDIVRRLRLFRDEASARDGEREALLRELTLVLSCTAANRVIEVVLEALVRLSGAQRGCLLLTRPDGAQEVVAARNMRGRDDASEQISRRVVVEVLAKGETLLLANALETPPWSLADSVTRLKLLSVLCVPVAAEGRTLGAVYLENRRVSGVFTEETARLAADFASRIGAALMNAEDRDALRRQREELQSALSKEYEFEGVVGVSPAFRELLHTVGVAARGDIPVLIEGESGTGKELIARAVHLRSPRRDGPFVSVNCAALPHGLLESELFGHTRGAFTGALRDRSGLFAAAGGGTLFLDEIGEMPFELQAKLLRVLQSGEYRPVGSDRIRRADARIVAATQRDLDREAAAKRFREDLFFRLNGIRVRIPPLRERKEDVPLLAERFLRKYAPEGKAPVLDREALACLAAYDYPGNVRELETIIRRAILFAQDGRIGPDALPDAVLRAAGPTVRLPLPAPATAAELLHAKGEASKRAVAEVERAFLAHALARGGGRSGEAARLAGMNRSQFARMLSRHGMGGRKGNGGEKGTCASGPF